MESCSCSGVKQSTREFDFKYSHKRLNAQIKGLYEMFRFSEFHVKEFFLKNLPI
jgi:hypothetical protein